MRRGLRPCPARLGSRLRSAVLDITEIDPRTERGIEVWERYRWERSEWSSGRLSRANLWLEILAESFLAGLDLRHLNVVFKGLEATGGGSQVRKSLIDRCTATAHELIRAHLLLVLDTPIASSKIGWSLSEIEFGVLFGKSSGTAQTLFEASRSTPGDALPICRWLGPSVTSQTGSLPAWKPSNSVAVAPTLDTVRRGIDAASWPHVAEWLRAVRPGLPVAVIGMPIIPADVIEASDVLLVNSHNGPLPGLRGLDSLAWSLALGVIPTATAHVIIPEVDRGIPLATSRVAVRPLETLAVRMKSAQVNVLLDALRSIGSRINDPTDRDAPSLYHGRMHPAIRSILDLELGSIGAVGSDVCVGD